MAVNRKPLTQREQKRLQEDRANEARLDHDTKMLKDPAYRGSMVGSQACVEDRRTGSVSFKNRYPGIEWAMEHVKSKMDIPTTYEAVDEFLKGYILGYMLEMSDTELDVSVSEQKLGRDSQIEGEV